MAELANTSAEHSVIPALKQVATFARMERLRFTKPHVITSKFINRVSTPTEKSDRIGFGHICAVDKIIAD